MTNEKLAHLLTQFCYKPKCENSPEFAAQLFIENKVIPQRIDAYTEKEMYEYILDYLRGI